MINIDLMAEHVFDQSDFNGRIAVILGSGLGGFAEGLEEQKVIPYKEIPSYPHSTVEGHTCLLYTSPSPRDLSTSRMPSSA